MAANEVLSSRNGAVLVLTFNRPDRANAMTLDVASQMFTVLKNATTDRSVRAVMLCGAGGNFMGGVDMNVFAGDINVALEHANNIVAPYHSAIRELQAMEKPVLAAVEGRVEGPGLSLMLASDLVISSRGARFNCKFTEYGLTPDGACSYFLPRKIGLNRAVELLMLSREFDTGTGERLGLVNRIVEDDKLQEEAMKLAVQLAEGPTKAYGGIKRLALQSFESNLNAHLGLEHAYFGQTSRSFDFREFLIAKSGGRPPKFTGT
ncbi:MAG: enoyl-CoA hydratase-related protein [Alphaproteobacteria bacterium]|nr:enoyl-CoA hydratase-related protein [Alphaproteobacteria bacterium]